MLQSTFFGAAFALGSLIWSSNAQVTTECDPTKVTCPNDQGLATDTYSIDFTKTKILPTEWQLANYANVSLGDQGAEFTFAKRYDAPTMWTKFKFFFGRVEFVVKAAPGVGIVSSMVLLSDDLDEIDWEFLGGVTTNVQTNYFGKGYTGTYNRSTSPAVASPQTQFHTYALDWSTAALTWSIDGVVVRTLNAADADGNGDQYPQSPMKISLSLWDAGDPDAPTQGWAGGVTPIPPPEPYTMYVKSVKVFNQNPAQQYQYTDKSGSWKSIKVINDVPFSSSSSLVSAEASTLSLGFTGSVSSSQLSQGSAGSLTQSSTGVVSTSTIASPSSSAFPTYVYNFTAEGSTSGSSNYLAASASIIPSSISSSAAATSVSNQSVDSHPVITVKSTTTSTVISCSGKSDCPTTTPPASGPSSYSDSFHSASSVAASSIDSTSTTHIIQTVTAGTSTRTSTLPSSASSKTVSTSASATSWASVTSVNKTMTVSPYPPPTLPSIGNLNQIPSINASSPSIVQSTLTAKVGSWSSSATWSSGIPGSSSASWSSSTSWSSTAQKSSSSSWSSRISKPSGSAWSTHVSRSSSASIYGIGSASASVSTIGSLIYTNLVPAGSTKTVTSTTTANCSTDHPPYASSGSSFVSSSATIWPTGFLAATSGSSSSASAMTPVNTWSTTVWIPTPSSASPSPVSYATPPTTNPLPPISYAKPPTTNPIGTTWSSAQASGLISTLATSPLTVLIPLSPLLSSPSATSSSAITKPNTSAQTAAKPGIISIGSLSASGFITGPNWSPIKTSAPGMPTGTSDWEDDDDDEEWDDYDDFNDQDWTTILSTKPTTSPSAKTSPTIATAGWVTIAAIPVSTSLNNGLSAPPPPPPFHGPSHTPQKPLPSYVNPNGTVINKVVSTGGYATGTVAFKGEADGREINLKGPSLWSMAVVLGMVVWL
ncbi:MAG: hypothetical protein Q9166_002519 [cf. Caloplaca sp. 2 TL-2023]